MAVPALFCIRKWEKPLTIGANYSIIVEPMDIFS